MRVSTNALKSVDHNGGLDAYLIKAKADMLSPRALDLNRAIEKRVGKPVFVKRRAEFNTIGGSEFGAAGSKDLAIFV
jgi:hypothetical protein